MKIVLLLFVFCSSVKKVTGAEKLRVQPGDTVTLTCNREFDETMWFSHQSDQTPVLISISKIPSTIRTIYRNDDYRSRFTPVLNSLAPTIDLKIENITEQDLLKLYYCGGMKDIQMYFGQSFRLFATEEQDGSQWFPLVMFLLPKVAVLGILLVVFVSYFSCIKCTMLILKKVSHIAVKAQGKYCEFSACRTTFMKELHKIT